jgi:hypothetical protein
MDSLLAFASQSIVKPAAQVKRSDQVYPGSHGARLQLVRLES